MLDNFNNIYKNMFVSLSKLEDSEKVKKLYNTNEFFLKFLLPIAIDANVRITKQRNNVFLVYGSAKDLKDFFKNLEVDETFIEDPKEFKIYSPMFTAGEVFGVLRLDQFYPVQHLTKYDVPTTHELENISRTILEGTWFSFSDKKTNLRIKCLKPTELADVIEDSIINGADDKKAAENVDLYVEFQVNTEQLKNQVWDEMSEWAPTSDEMNDMHNAKPEDFDYTKLNAKDKEDEAVVKKALKDVKTTAKTFKSEVTKKNK